MEFAWKCFVQCNTVTTYPVSQIGSDVITTEVCYPNHGTITSTRICNHIVGYPRPISSVTLHLSAVGRLVHLLTLSGASHTVFRLGTSWFCDDITANRNACSKTSWHRHLTNDALLDLLCRPDYNSKYEKNIYTKHIFCPRPWFPFVSHWKVFKSVSNNLIGRYLFCSKRVKKATRLSNYPQVTNVSYVGVRRCHSQLFASN